MTVTVESPLLALSPVADGTLSVVAATGALTITTPAVFAGTYVTDTTLLATGPVSLSPPRIAGQTQAGAVLTAQTGLWIFKGQATAEAWSCRRNGTEIAGATAATYTVTPADQGAVLTVVQTLKTAGGSWSAGSAALSIPVPFTPAADASFVLWYVAALTATITRSGNSVASWAPRTGTGALAGTRRRAGRERSTG